MNMTNRQILDQILKEFWLEMKRHVPIGKNPDTEYRSATEIIEKYTEIILNNLDVVTFRDLHKYRNKVENDRS